LAFSPQYASAVEAKQVAQQEAETAKYLVEKALEEKKSIVISAQVSLPLLSQNDVCCVYVHYLRV
jgi:hypothetical protein